MYNVDTFFLAGDVSLDRTKNTPSTKFSYLDQIEMNVNGKNVVGHYIQHNDITSESLATLVLRMYFVVHSYLNLTIVDEDNQILFGH